MAPRQRHPSRLKFAPARQLAAGGISILLAAALAFVALGCSDTSSDDDQAASDTGRTTDTSEAASADTAPATTVIAAPTTTPSEVIVDVKVTQIPGGPRESTVSALREGMTAPLLPEPLVSPLDVLSGGPPPDGIPSIDGPEFE